MNNTLAKMIPLLARGIAPTAALASGLMSPLALGASGDLDPTFADMGRLGPLPNFAGAAGVLEPLTDNDGILFGGGNFEADCVGGYYCDYEFDAHGFLGRSSGTGSIDTAFSGAGLQDTEVLDVALLPDGKVIAVGRTVLGVSRYVLSVFRLQRDGSLDPSFGQAGITQLPTTDSTRHSGSSVAVDPDGRIVVAGFQGYTLMALRLSPDGALDAGFGVDGIFLGPAVYASPLTRIVRTASGRYRVAAGLRDLRNGNTFGSPCLLVGLTADGEIDEAFGTLGVTSFADVVGESAVCSAMVGQADGKLLVAGSDDAGGFAVRLLDSGERDAGFRAPAIAAGMRDTTALGLRADGSIVVAGRGNGVSAALIMQLQANGELDTLFGNDGSTLVDLPSGRVTAPYVNDIAVLPDGRVLAAGGDLATRPARPFLVRLIGEAGGDSPGVLGVAQPELEVKEQEQQALITVKRMGGSAGSVSVGYQTMTGTSPSATGGQDYTQASGRLQWSDGEVADKQIVVPIASNTGNAEEHEHFAVALSDVQGGAGLGTRNATVRIAADGEPAGQFSIQVVNQTVSERDPFVSILVNRDFYSTGAVSVTLTTSAGTASAGDDFVPETVVVSWADGENWSKAVAIAIRDDATDEGSETFTVRLSNPTGGAVVGPHSEATITIGASDPSLNSGGGWFGYWCVLFFGAVAFLRSLRARSAAIQLAR
jgi:uncharacterized delta-60 repeat protein